MHEDTVKLKKYLADNKALWNQRTQLHTESKFYDVAAFKQGNSVLNNIELDILGDVKGKSLLHLQCHFGMDSLDFARRGASVTGVDFSDAAIDKATALNKELNLNAKFICSDVYELLTNELITEQYDIVFTSYGTIGWLPNLDKWAQVVAKYLKPGGQFLIVDFHPALWMYSDDFSELAYSYFNKEVITTNSATYTENSNEALGAEHGWNHSFGEILSALLNQGLQLKQFEEYDYSPYPCFANSIATAPNHYQIKGMEGRLPMLYSISMYKS
jgi:2-polyprenyl-3-methyl-5-hydroxy-6-metoxy-1,4-benzoquinol methylase